MNEKTHDLFIEHLTKEISQCEEYKSEIKYLREIINNLENLAELNIYKCHVKECKVHKIVGGYFGWRTNFNGELCGFFTGEKEYYSCEPHKINIDDKMGWDYDMFPFIP